MVLLSSTTWIDPEMAYQDAFVHYLPVNEATMLYGVYVTGAGHVSVPSGESCPPFGQPASDKSDWQHGRTLPDFQLVLLTGGGGEFESEVTGSIRVEGAALAFLLPGVWHRYRPATDIGWSERWISFNGELVHRLFDNGLFGPSLAVSKPRNPERLANEFDELLNDINQRSAQHPAVLIFKALRVISSAVAERIEESGGAGAVPVVYSACSSMNDPIVQSALELIWTGSHKPMSASDIARQLPVTRRTLDRRFAEATGHSVLEEINVCRLSRAKRLLLETDLPVKTIARQAGFSSTERMRVSFVEREGTSPTVFRKRMIQARERAQRSKDSDVNINWLDSPALEDEKVDPLS